MSLDAGVRCRCWDEGKATPAPLPQHVRVSDEGFLELDLPWETNLPAHGKFDRWRQSACAHENMWLACERVSNWSGVRAFQQALDAAGAERFVMLLDQIPNANGGLTLPAAARRCLAELDAFMTLEGFGEQVWLIDGETKQRLHNFIAAYEGVFIMIGKGRRLDIGLDRDGFFLREPEGGELLRAMMVEQVKFGEEAFEFFDPSTNTRVQVNHGVASGDGAYPRRLSVEISPDGPGEYTGIVERLRAVFSASAASGNPVIWL